MEAGRPRKHNMRLAPIWVFGLVVVAQFVFDPFFELVVFRHGWLAPLHRATNGFVTGTLIAYWVMLPTVVGGIIYGLGKLRPGDIGLRKGDIRAAALFTLLLWTVVAGAECLGQMEHFVLDPAWTKPGPVALGGMLFSQIFGNALYEEIVFRGFLTLQIFRWCGEMVRWKALVIAIIGAQLIFASIHIPVLLHSGADAMQVLQAMPMLFVLGVGLAVIFLVTNNLLIVVGVHALMDWPYLIGHDVSGLGDNFSVVYLVIALVTVCFWRLGFSQSRNPLG